MPVDYPVTKTVPAGRKVNISEQVIITEAGLYYVSVNGYPALGTLPVTVNPVTPPPLGLWLPKSDAPIHWQWMIGEVFQYPAHKIANVSIYDIDWEINSAATVASLHADGCKVIAYLEAGDWNSIRGDAGQFPENVKGDEIEGWNERWLDIRSPIVRSLVSARIDVAKAKGFDAIEPDCIEGYANDTYFGLTYQDQLGFNIWLANYCHSKGMSVCLKGDTEQAADLQPYFDFCLNEECNRYGECGILSAFVNANKAVLNVEYRSQDMKCAAMKTARINSMRRNTGLTASGVRSPCIPDTQNTW